MRFFSFLWVLLCIQQGMVCGQTLPDSLIKSSVNYIQFSDRSAISSAAKAWQGAPKEQFVVLHVGDSHLQNENLPNKSRALIHQLLGDGGIGLIEPFSIVNSYDASFYKSTHTGKWENAKSYKLPPPLPLGVRGMTAKTTDVNASFTLKFSSLVSEANNVLTLFVENTPSNFFPIILIDSIPATLLKSEAGILEYALPNRFKSLTLKLTQPSPDQKDFTIYGMSLSNASRTGSIWHNAGVGASQYKSLLYEDKYAEQVNYLKPDLVIVDFGTNDFLYKNTVPSGLRLEIDRIIAKVRSASPAASIILTSAQHMLFKGKDISAALEFSVLVKEIAKVNNCGFWDWYQIAGGANAMSTWLVNGHSMKDGIHLNGKGSMLKGSLLFSALENTFQKFLADSNLQELTIETPIPIPVFESKSEIHTEAPVKAERLVKPKKMVLHVVKKGHTLSQIADIYHVSISMLKKLNKLKSDRISIGQEIRVNK